MDNARVLSVNVATVRPIDAKDGRTGIDKRPVDGPVEVAAPEVGGSGVGGDTICDTANHGGPDQAVYAYAREDLDKWEAELDRPLSGGIFGENLTTEGVDVNGAVIGERWRVGSAVLEVSCPRIPCRTFALWLEREKWQRTFTERAIPGAYLRVAVPGRIAAGDGVVIEHRPGHGLTIGEVFRAVTLEPELLPRLVDVAELPEDIRALARKRAGAR